MLEIRVSPKFERLCKKLSGEVRMRLGESVNLLAQDPFDSQLHMKKLSGSFQKEYSFRLGRDWRVFFEFMEDGAIRLTDILPRKDAYR